MWLFIVEKCCPRSYLLPKRYFLPKMCLKRKESRFSASEGRLRENALRKEVDARGLVSEREGGADCAS